MNRKQILGAAAVLAAITVLVYCPAMRGGFIWDDGDMLTNNPLIKSASGLRDIWAGKLTDYHPLTYSVFWLEWRCWGMDPAGYHVVNILLHAANVALLWLVLRKLRIPGCWLAALLFAVHPVCVASVAWIAELKNTLSMLFFFAALLGWLQSGEREDGNRKWYLPALGCFLLALLAKVSVVVFPVLLLLLAWWRHGRISRRDLARTAPFFLLAAALGLFGMTFQNKYAAVNDPLLVRLLAGGWAVWFYLWKIFWPVHLTIIYPRWTINAASPEAWIPGICFAVMLLVFWLKRAGWGRPLLFGMGCFVIALAPVLGPFKLVYFYFSQAADHLQYLALPAIIALVVAGGWEWLGRNKTAAWAVGGALAAVLSVLTWQDQSQYADMASLWRDNLAKNPKSFQALLFAGAEAEAQGHYERAYDMFQRAVAVRLQSPDANLNLGIVLYDLGRMEEARAQAEKALQIKPEEAETYILLARLSEKKGLLEESARYLREAVRVAPNNVRAYQYLGHLLANQGRLDEAIQEFGKALKLNADDPTLFVEMGYAQGRRGDMDAALACFQKALSLDPKSADAQKGLEAVRQRQSATNAPSRR